MTDITYEPGVYRTAALDYRLQQGNGTPKVQITHRRHNSAWWDIAYGANEHTQEAWDAIKREGVKIA